MQQIEYLILKRWSPRAFSTRMVEADKLEALFEAARWAPSSGNRQPWHFVYATRDGEPESWQKLYDALDDGNRRWNGNVPLLIAIVAHLNSGRDGKPNRHAIYDTGQSVSMITLQATKMGLFAHQMAGFYPEKVKEAMNIPDGFDVIAMMAVGYMGNKEDLPEPYRTRETQPRTRKETKEFVFKGGWNTNR